MIPHEVLVTRVLEAARTRGYRGQDAQAATELLAGPDPALLRLGAAAADLWLAFFAGFHPRLSPVDTGQLQGGIDQLNQRLRALPPGTPPDPELAADLLTTLEDLWEQRHAEVVAHLDQTDPGLSTALAAALAQAGLVPAQEETDGDRLTRLLAHWQRVADGHRLDARETTAAVGVFLKAVRAAVAGEATPTLPGEAGTIVASVVALARARREAEKDLRSQRLAPRPPTVVTPPPPPAPTPVPEDARLTLYRQALAAWESGGDPGPALAQVREIERVVTFGAAEAERTRKVLDRCHEQAVRRLIELYDLAPLTDDPRRYRPRGLLGLGRKAEHDLRSLPGLTEALAACARDLAVYAEAAAAVVGVGILAQEAPRIRAVFGELIKLIAHWRAQLGDPPPISVTMSLDGGSGIVALPGVVAQDLEALARRKAKAGPAATVLAPLLEECVALYRASLTKAGATVPPRTVKKPREGALASVTRLAAELGELATCCQTAFAEVARQGFAPTPAQQALLDDNHLLRSALAALSEGAVALASGTSCPPAPNEGTIPTGDPAAQSAAITRLGSWYTTVLAYRIVQA